MNYKCLICQIKGLENRIEKFQIPNKKRDDLVAQIISYLSEVNFSKSYSPEITQHVVSLLQEHSPTSDPYQSEKDESNNYLLGKYSDFKQQIADSSNSFDTALRLAIAGNIIDFGPNRNFNVDDTINEVLSGDFKIDHSKELRQKISEANSILYLADNCGEIVLDKLFLETINHKNVTVVVRDKVILNDATLKEAKETGVDKIAKVISNGDNSPSTLLHRTSQKFNQLFETSDLIISKGMGNFEGLMDLKDPRIFFLFMVKCHIIGEKIDASEGDFVVKNAAS